MVQLSSLGHGGDTKSLPAANPVSAASSTATTVQKVLIFVPFLEGSGPEVIPPLFRGSRWYVRIDFPSVLWSEPRGVPVLPLPSAPVGPRGPRSALLAGSDRVIVLVLGFVRTLGRVRLFVHGVPPFSRTLNDCLKRSFYKR